ncbi:MAG TPA: nuclear transport factor 2 family protein [Trebonia sp.]|jgi:ketosteroid isomerase-like protein
MYHAFVKSKVRSTFAQISAGQWESMLKAMAPRFTYVFYGNSALSGERRSIEAIRQWWQRSARLIPDATFEVLDVIVSGGPWNTAVATAVAVHGTLADGSPYDNVFNQFMRMKWGRITEIRTLENTEVLQQAMDRLAAAGYPEAHAAPISDESARASQVS